MEGKPGPVGSVSWQESINVGKGDQALGGVALAKWLPSYAKAHSIQKAKLCAGTFAFIFCGVNVTKDYEVVKGRRVRFQNFTLLHCIIKTSVLDACTHTQPARTYYTRLVQIVHRFT